MFMEIWFSYDRGESTLISPLFANPKYLFIYNR